MTTPRFARLLLLGALVLLPSNSTCRAKSCTGDACDDEEDPPALAVRPVLFLGPGFVPTLVLVGDAD